MNPAVAASGSGGLAGAVVVLLNAVVEHFVGHPLSADVIAAEVTLVTALAGVGAHYLTRVVPPAPPAAAPAEPAAHG
jgi:hypothetical protein